MSRIETIFKTKKSAGKKALVTFITACDPDYETSLSVLKSLPESGADIIELGMPFTDPGADGPVIEAASRRALENGADMHKTLQMVQEFRKDNTDTPLVLMGYYNPIMAYGLENFVKDFGQASIDGLIIVDLPPEEDKELRTLANDAGIDLIRLITPTSNDERLPALLHGTSGFLYYVSITGVTGTASADLDAIGPHIQHIQSQTDLPVVIGFGIKTPSDVQSMKNIADGVVVGSEIVKTLQNHKDSNPEAAVSELVKNLSSAL